MILTIRARNDTVRARFSFFRPDVVYNTAKGRIPLETGARKEYVLCLALTHSSIFRKEAD